MEISSNGIRLNYDKEGNGPAVLLLHGNGASLHFFDKLVPLLASSYTVYRMDSRRHGKSEKTKEISYDLMMQDAADFIKALNIQRPAVIGSSDGGITGLLLTIHHPNLLGCNIACGANTNPKVLKRWFYWLFKLGSLKPGQQNLRMVVEEPDITDRQLSAITTPTLIMAGERDITIPGHQQALAAAIPNAELCLLPGESHTSYFDKPEVFMANAGSFLRKYAR